MPLKICSVPVSSSRFPVFNQFFLNRRLLFFDWTHNSVCSLSSVIVDSCTMSLNFGSSRTEVRPVSSLNIL